jgi:hypothetical protein
MIAVVAFALSIKLGISYSRSPNYWEEARFYDRAASNARFLAGLLESEDTSARTPRPVSAPSPTGFVMAKVGVTTETVPSSDLPGDERREAAIRSQKFADYLDQMRSKYRRAAFLPWLPNAPEVP